MNRACHNCEHFYTDYESDYSELTPGAGPQISCKKRHYFLGESELLDVDPIRRALRLGETCEDFLSIPDPNS